MTIFVTLQQIDEAADALRGVLRGQKGPMRDIALLNAAAALVVAEQAADLPSAMLACARAVDSGRAQKTLETLVRCSQAV